MALKPRPPQKLGRPTPGGGLVGRCELGSAAGGSRDYGYHPNILPAMVAQARRHLPTDRLFVDMLIPHLRPGTVLEIGAGCGQLSKLLMARGWDVLASDIQPFLVEYMAGQGLRAEVLDATDLRASIDLPQDNVLAQSISTLITPDLEVVRRTYESVHAVLRPGGRFVFVLPSRLGAPWSSASSHLRIAESTGFDLVVRFRHQALPSSWYGRLPTGFLRAVDSSIGRILGVRWVLVFATRPAAHSGSQPHLGT